MDQIGDDLDNYTLQTPAAPPSEGVSNFTKKWGSVLKTSASVVETDLLTELREYLALKPLSEKKRDSFKLLLWWRNNEANFPLLSKIAQKVIVFYYLNHNDDEKLYVYRMLFLLLFYLLMKVHSIVATSAPSERAFSSQGNIITEKRSQLLPWNANMFLFIHSNFGK